MLFALPFELFFRSVSCHKRLLPRCRCRCLGSQPRAFLGLCVRLVRCARRLGGRGCQSVLMDFAECLYVGLMSFVRLSHRNLRRVLIRPVYICRGRGQRVFTTEMLHVLFVLRHRFLPPALLSVAHPCELVLVALVAKGRHLFLVQRTKLI